MTPSINKLNGIKKTEQKHAPQRLKILNKSDKEKRFFLDKGAKYQKAKLICKQCHAIYDGQGWKAFEKMDPKISDELRVGICPACHETNDHISDGVLNLTGAGMEANKQEIKNLIHNVGKQEEQDDILNRVERIEENEQGMTVYTTKNQLAVELGKKIAAAHKGGELEITWSKDDKPVEVNWNLELKPAKNSKKKS